MAKKPDVLTAILQCWRLRFSSWIGWALFLSISFATSSALPAQQSKLTPKQQDHFERFIRPTFVNKCISCHGASKQEGELRLTSLESILAGGESGPAISTDQPSKSLLLEAIGHKSLEMPPDEKLDRDTIDAITQWVKMGAPWPANTILKPSPKITKTDRTWWSYQPIKTPALPQIPNQDWCQNEIDHFILKRLRSEKIVPSQSAKPLALLRRIHFTLTGLPPDKKLIQEVLSQQKSFDQVISELLASKAYGEHQAQYWLDLVRFAETDGYRADHFRPQAKLYRDYVIASFNQDKPYDRFVTEQLAGDEIDPGNRQSLVATMFLRHWIYEHNQRDVETQWQEILSDLTETTADVFLAQGVKCARCHDHKFDPILQKDYFRLQAFFAPFQPAENHPVADLKTREAYFEQLKKWEESTESIRQRIHEIESPELLKNSTREGFVKFIPKIKRMIEKRQSQRSPYEQQIASLASRQFDVHPEKLPKQLSKQLNDERLLLREKLKELAYLKPKPLPVMKFVGTDVGPAAPPTFIPGSEKTPISPGFLTILDAKPAKITPVSELLRTTGRRSELARWIVSRDNPLTARVIVNRIWQQHFGTGLVETSSDFGQLGSPPSHPELLDYLATQFMENNWSLKFLHAQILSSATFQQSSLRIADPKIQKIDPQNRLLWRMNFRRLSGEEIIDAALTCSGELNKTKRAIFKTVRRNSPDPLLELFDSPDRIRSVGNRHRTTTSTQALLLTNGKWMWERAEKIAERLDGKNTQEFIKMAYRRMFGRVVTDSEIALAEQFLQDYQTQTPVVKEQPTIVPVAKSKRQAIDLNPGNAISIRIAPRESIAPKGQFSLESIVILRSLYKDAKVRTIVSQWTGNQKDPGWSLGVTSTKSAYKPRNLILQLIGDTKSKSSANPAKKHYEVIASNLRLDLEKPYYLAVSVNARDTKAGVRFYLKDLSNPSTKIQTATVNHSVVSNFLPKHGIQIGERFGTHRWDGLLDRVNLWNGLLSPEQVQSRSDTIEQSVSIEQAASVEKASSTQQIDSVKQLADRNELNAFNALFSLQFENPKRPGFDSSKHENHARFQRKVIPKTAAQKSRIALVHALLNSNEFIYVD